MAGTAIYSVDHSEGIVYYPTKKEALRVWREIKADGEEYEPRITKLTITDSLPRRELFCALLNSEAFAGRQEDITP